MGGTGPGGDYLQDPAKYYSHIAAAGEGPAQTEWVECSDGGSPGEPVGHAAVIEVGQPVAIAAAVATGGEPIKPEQHVAVEEQERRTHEALDGLDGSAKKRYRRDDAPPETGFDALPTAWRELDVSLPAGDAPTKLTSALKPLAPTGPRTATVLSHRLNTQVELTLVPASGECYLSIAASAEEEAVAGEEPVLPERGSPAAPLEDRGEHDGLYGNAFAEAGMKAGVALGFSNEPPETSTEALPTTRRELGTPLPAGNTPAKLASAPKPPAPVGPRAESTEPEWLAIAAEIMYVGSDSSSNGAFEAAAEASVDITSWQDAPQTLAPIVEETAGSIAALAPSGAGAVRELAAADAVTTGATAPGPPSRTLSRAATAPAASLQRRARPSPRWSGTCSPSSLGSFSPTSPTSWPHTPSPLRTPLRA